MLVLFGYGCDVRRIFVDFFMLEWSVPPPVWAF